MPTEYQELLKAISLIEEMNEYLNTNNQTQIWSESIFHQQMRGILDDYYMKRKQ